MLRSDSLFVFQEVGSRMLVELRAENYAVIDHAIAALGPGLNLLTGETGAGKSILVDALALLMGGKSSVDVVRHGADKAVVSCVFESTPGADAILEENGIDSEGADIILRREILSTGKGRVFINNQPATVAVLKQLAPELALVHAQSETHLSFDQTQQRILLDRFAGLSTDAVAEAYARWRAAQEKLDSLLQGEQDRLRMVDLWSYQNKEISAAHLVPGEDEALETEKRVLANSEKLYAASMGAFDQLYEGGASAEVALRAALRNVEELARYDARFTDAVQQLTSARAILGDVSSTLRDYAEGIDASPERLAEIEDRLALLDRLKRKYGHTIDEVIAVGEDVARKLSEVEDRDELLKELRKALDEAAKAYQVEASALSVQRKVAAAKLAKLAEAQINSLAMKVKFEVAVYSPEDLAAIEASSAEDTAFSKTSGRAEKGIVSSGTLSPEISAALKGQDFVALKGHSLSRDAEAAVSSATGIAALKGKSATGSVAHKQSFVTGHDFSRAENVAKLKEALAPAGSPSETHQSHWTSSGWDEVECRIATNPGEPLKPLHEIASGGEMSRVMLALKVTVEEAAAKPKTKTPTPRTLVFDEIDIGIGGRAAEAVGQKLKSLGRGQQVLCVTHLPQIAAFADQHLVVEKHVSEGRTRTRIRVLDDRARTHEVARMLSGATVTETSLQHAAQMIASSR
jgi:DNA repair protein RecN (Recombination protein N)